MVAVEAIETKETAISGPFGRTMATPVVSADGQPVQGLYRFLNVYAKIFIGERWPVQPIDGNGVVAAGANQVVYG